MATVADTLSSAIEKAVESHKEDSGLGGDSQVESTSVGQADVSEEPVSEEVAQSEEPKVVEDQDAEQGRTLVQALRDPTKAPFIIDWLARQNGYSKETIETKRDVKEAKSELTGILEAELGEELKFIAPKLGAALDKYLEKALSAAPRNEEIENLRGRVEMQERSKIESEISDTHTAISQEYFGSNDMPENVGKSLSAAMDQFPPSDSNMSASTYYRKIFNFVVGELGLTKKNPAQVRQGDKVQKAKDDSVARNLSATNRGVTPSAEGNPKKFTLNDAISKAMADLSESNGSKK